ncbi:hypothetical protein VTK73DRAFT_5456 [Phialemonium thermophilum]|uniref:Uncharacterized protein n=1 Tax=Phialemonium thermophilum TaxID=223376 RepID=A0ABR3V1R2_9PEZI
MSGKSGRCAWPSRRPSRTRSRPARRRLTPHPPSLCHYCCWWSAQPALAAFLGPPSLVPIRTMEGGREEGRGGAGKRDSEQLVCAQHRSEFKETRPGGKAMTRRDQAALLTAPQPGALTASEPILSRSSEREKDFYSQSGTTMTTAGSGTTQKGT